MACTCVLVLCACALVWRIIPLDTWFTAENLSALSRYLRAHPLAPLYVIGLYTLGGLTAFPVFILIPATAMIFGPLLGCLYSLCGLVVNASVLYALGHLIGRDTINHYVGHRMQHMSRRLVRNGFIAVALLRLLPVAPFTLVNLISGASPVTFGTYTAATVAGISPALICMSLAGAQLNMTLHNPALQNLMICVILSILILTLGIWLRRKGLKRTSLN